MGELNSESAPTRPPSRLSVPINLAESSHDSEKRASVWQIGALTSALMQENRSGEISHEREASGGVSMGARRRGLAPSGVRPAGSSQGDQANMWM